MKKLLLSFMMLCVCLVEAQTGYEKNIISHGIYLNRSGGVLNYAIDKPRAIYYNSLATGPLYASARSQNVNILMEYINPLKMSYEISYSNQVNPDLENMVKFFNALSPFLKEIGFSSEEGKFVDLKDVFKSIEGSAAALKVENKDFKTSFYSEELYQLGLLLVSNPDCYFENYDKVKALSIASNTLSVVEKSELNSIFENYLKNLGALSNAEVDFQEYNKLIRVALQELINADDVSKVKEVYPNYQQAKKKIADYRTTQEKRLTHIKDFLDGKDEIAVVTSNKGKKIDSLRAVFVKAMRKFYQESYINKVNNQFKAIDKLIEQMDALALKFKKGIDVLIGCEKCEMGMKLAEIPISPEDIKVVSINIKTYEIEITEDMQLKVTENSNLNGTISLKNYSKITVDFGTGPLYLFGFSFNKYSTELNPATGILNVVKTRPEQMNFAVGTMLNIIWKTDTYPVFPMGQIGFALGKDAPVVFAGLGIKTIKNISISAGILTGWYKELNNLSVGTPVKGDGDLINDYRYRPVKNAAAYIGIQYSF